MVERCSNEVILRPSIKSNISFFKKIPVLILRLYSFLDKKYCEPNPCKNSGKCITISGGYRCICEKFKGVNCESKLIFFCLKGCKNVTFKSQ